MSRPQGEVEFAPANIWASVVHNDFDHVTSVTHDETGAERQTAMGGCHAMGVEFAPGRNAVPLPVDRGNHEARRSCMRWGQRKAKRRRQKRAFQKHRVVRKPFALSARYKVAARAEAEAGKLIHGRDVPRTDIIDGARFLPAHQQRGNPTSGTEPICLATCVLRVFSGHLQRSHY